MEQAKPVRRLYTVEEYFRLELASDRRHEYRDGEVIDMAGAEPEHTDIVKNLVRHVDDRLAGSGCRSWMLDQRVLTDRTRYAYPDVSVACEPLEYLPGVRPKTLVNPRVIIEVLSESTELVDRAEKFYRYMNIQSLVEYVLVAQDRARAETFVREPLGMWRLAGWVEGLEASLHVRTFGFEIPLAKIYAGVTFPPVSDDEER